MRIFVLVLFLLTSGCTSLATVDSPSPLGDEALLKLIYSIPDGEGPFPAVVLMHGCSGLGKATLSGLQRHASYLKENGFASVIVDSFSGRGKAGGMVCRSKKELRNARFYRQYDALNVLADLQSDSNFDPNNFFMMGQSNGGGVAVQLASGESSRDYPDQPKFRAIVAYYPPCSALSYYIEIPLLVLGGREDDWTPPAACEHMKNWIQGAEYEVVVYEGAHHSFDLPISLQLYEGHTVAGNSKVAKISREKMLSWFQSHMQ